MRQPKKAGSLTVEQAGLFPCPCAFHCHRNIRHISYGAIGRHPHRSIHGLGGANRTGHTRTHTHPRARTRTYTARAHAHTHLPSRCVPPLSLSRTPLDRPQRTGEEHVECGPLLPPAELHRCHTEPARLDAAHGFRGHSHRRVADARHAGAACRLAAAHLDTGLAPRGPRCVDWVSPSGRRPRAVPCRDVP